MTDQELRDALSEIDENSDIDVTAWEADFLETVLFKQGNRPLSSKQREIAERMIKDYLK